VNVVDSPLFCFPYRKIGNISSRVIIGYVAWCLTTIAFHRVCFRFHRLSLLEPPPLTASTASSLHVSQKCGGGRGTRVPELSKRLGPGARSTLPPATPLEGAAGALATRSPAAGAAGAVAATPSPVAGAAGVRDQGVPQDTHSRAHCTFLEVHPTPWGRVQPSPESPVDLHESTRAASRSSQKLSPFFLPTRGWGVGGAKYMKIGLCPEWEDIL